MYDSYWCKQLGQRVGFNFLENMNALPYEIIRLARKGIVKTFTGVVLDRTCKLIKPETAFRGTFQRWTRGFAAHSQAESTVKHKALAFAAAGT